MLPGFFQDGSAPVIKGQHPDIGNGGRKIFSGEAQTGAHDHPVDAAAGVALGLGGFNDGIQGGAGTAGVHELPPQTFGTVGQGLKGLIAHGSQTSQNGSLAGGDVVERGVFEKFHGFAGNVRLPIAMLHHQSPDGGGGGILQLGLGVMVVASPMDGHGLQVGFLGQDGFAVFHSQNIIGAFQQCAVQTHFFQSRLTGCGERFAQLQLTSEQRREFLAEKCFGGVHQGILVGGFCAETEFVTKTGEDLHAAGSKALGRGEGINGGQLQHQICPAPDGSFSPDGFIDNGRDATLDKIAAHQTDNGGIFPLKQVDLLLVAGVQWIVFAYNSNSIQNNSFF